MTRSASAIALVLVSACTVTRSLPYSPLARTSVSRVSRTQPTLLYVSDPLGNAIDVYRASGRSQSPIAVIREGIHRPAGMAVDSADNLYVANTANDTVTEYGRNGSSPVTTYAKNVHGPVAVAIDDSGILYVANFGSLVEAIVEFAPGSTTPTGGIVAPCSCYPIGLGLDARQTLYVAYDDFYAQTSVYAYAQGSSNGTEVNLQFQSTRWETPGIIFDKRANLLLSNASLPGIQVFPPGHVRSRTILGKRGSPRFLQFEPDEKALFVADTADNAVDEYSYPKGELTDVITDGLTSVYGVALSPRAPF